MERQELERLSREGLIEIAEKLGVARPRVLTQPDLVDEILQRTATSDRERARARGWLGRARDLISRVVEKGLHLPDTARALGAASPRAWPSAPPPLPTVTLAEIYAAQGHLERAIAVLDEVLAKEPEHKEAHALRERLRDQARRGRARGKIGPAAAPSAAEEPAAVADTTATPVTEPAANAEAPVAERAAVHESALSSASLPERYEVDEIVAIGVDPHTVYLYWEVRPTTLAHARARRPEGRLAVRVVSVVPSWDGPAVRTRDYPVDALYGDWSVRGLDAGSIVRVSVGWVAHEHYQPIAIGDEVATPRALPVDEPAPAGAARARFERRPDGAFEPMERGAGARAAAYENAPGPALRDDTRDTGGRAPAPGFELDVEEPYAEPVLVTTRTRRVLRGGASELAWEDLTEEERALRRARRRARELTRGGASDLARGGASELGLRDLPKRRAS